MTKPLKQALKDHYGQHVLSPEQLRSLASAAKSSLVGQVPPRRRLILWTAAAAVAVVLGIAYWAGWGQEGQVEAVVAEMSHNHSKRFEPEVTTDSYEEIRRQMTKLDFSVAPSTRLAQARWGVTGARYCSVRGVTAARIGLVDRDTSTAFTLYQAPIPSGLHLQGTVERLHGGNKVTLWVEHGLLFGLVGPP